MISKRTVAIIQLPLCLTLQLGMPSTFLQAYVPPVYMPDDDNENDAISPSLPGSVDSGKESEDSDSDLELPNTLLDSEEYRELQALRDERQRKLVNSNAQHMGYKVVTPSTSDIR